jgi:hypothetical protein
MPDKPAAFYIPVNLDPRAFTAEDRDYGHYFLNQLHWRYVCFRADGDGFVRLKWDYLTRVIPRPVWHRIHDVLTLDGGRSGPVVETDGWYAPGRKAIGFRLGPAYRAVYRVECATDALNRKIRAAAAGRETRLLPVHHWLASNLGRLRFDADLAAAIIPTLSPDGGFRITPAEYAEMLTGLARRVADGERGLSCDRYGRVHTPLTSLPRELRRCVSAADGSPLVGLDLANSQPLMAGLLARRFSRSESTAVRMCAAAFRGAGNPYCYRALAEHADHPGVPADLRGYLGCCAAGTLYESFGGDRERVKRRFMSVLMGHNHYGGRAKDEFSARYPRVAEMLHAVRRKEHARAAWLLQNLEATLFIHRACGRLMRARPDLPVYTVHDCVFTVPDGVPAVRGVLLDEFARLGVEPTLKHC